MSADSLLFRWRQILDTVFVLIYNKKPAIINGTQTTANTNVNLTSCFCVSIKFGLFASAAYLSAMCRSWGTINKIQFDSKRAIGIQRNIAGRVIRKPFKSGIADLEIPAILEYASINTVTTTMLPKTRMGNNKNKYVGGFFFIFVSNN